VKVSWDLSKAIRTITSLRQTSIIGKLNLVNIRLRFYSHIPILKRFVSRLLVTDNAYRRYLEEKKAYSKELEEETKIRLEKIQQKLQQSQKTDNQASKDQSIKQSPQVATTTNSKSVPETTKKSAPVDQENRAKWAYKRFVEITK
jgi:hypothetical protein